MCKIFEHLFKKRLEWWAETRQLLPPHQYGFRSGRSTIDSIVNLVSTVQCALAENETVIVTFADIQGAFDNVPIHLLLRKLYQLGLPKHLIKILHSLLSDRLIFLQQGSDVYGPRRCQIGVPQGSVLSPILFALYTSDLADDLPDYCQPDQFADDTLNLTKHLLLPTCVEQMNVGNDYFMEWIERKGFSISPGKSQLLIFTRRRYDPATLDIRLNDERPRNIFLGQIFGVIHRLQTHMEGSYRVFGEKSQSSS